MEDSSHELIEQLIAEEKYCYGFEGVPVENVVKDMRKAPLENPFMRTNSSVAEAESNLQGKISRQKKKECMCNTLREQERNEFRPFHHLKLSYRTIKGGQQKKMSY